MTFDLYLPSMTISLPEKAFSSLGYFIFDHWHGVIVCLVLLIYSLIWCAMKPAAVYRESPVEMNTISEEKRTHEKDSDKHKQDHRLIRKKKLAAKHP
jgi:hypothetical protein